MDVSNCRFNLSKWFKPFAQKPGLVPLLRTAMPDKRVSSFTESVLALRKRNMAAPRLQDCANEFEIIDSVISKARKTFFVEELIDDSMTNSKQGALRWWEKQSTTAKAQISRDWRSLDDIDFTAYNFMIKNDVKPKMDKSPQHEYSALQTVVYPDKIVNAVFGPIMKEINERILHALKPWVVFNSRMTSEELNSRVDFLPMDVEFEKVEIDFSKYDKSKTGLHIRAVIQLYKMFGLDDFFSLLWEKSQTQTIVKDRTHGVEAYILHQQKSGNCDTYGSNTWTAALALLDTLPLEDAIFSIFGGDDSLILFPKGKVIVNPCPRLASLWNFDCKFFKFTIPMFCGKFLLKTDKGYVFAPDPVKLITKLGRRDIADAVVLSEIYTSISDNYSCYFDERILSALSVAVIDRYKAPYDAKASLYSLTWYLRSFERFSLLFNCKEKFVNVKIRKDYDW
jgi:hypothetical protein